MEIGYILQLILFVLLALGIVWILGGFLRAIPRPHKVKTYRYSKSGDDWVKNVPKPR